MKNYIFVFVCLLHFGMFSQNNTIYKNIISEINKYDVIKAKDAIAKLTNEDERLFFLSEITYLETGLLNQQAIIKMSSTENPFLKAIYYNSFGDLQLRTSKKLTPEAFKNYINSLKVSQNLNDDFLKQEAFRRILFLHQLNMLSIKDFEYYSEKYITVADDSVNIFWAKYYQVFKLIYDLGENKKVDISEKDFDALFNLTNKNNVLIAKTYHLQDVYFYVVNDMKNAEISIKKSIEYYKKSELFITKKALISIAVNQAMVDIDINKAKIAIKTLRAINQENAVKNDGVLKIFILNALQKAYTKIEKLDSAVYFFNESNAVGLKIKIDENYLKAHEIDTKYQTAQKDSQISYLKTKYNQNKALYLSLIFLVFLLAFYSFVRWKKEDRKRKKEQLEKQSFETMYQNTAEELQKTKQLVIEDYIILKNNAKIYLEELIYIKSEDHYLELITTNKKEFVRGKMSEIIQQLPPNFQKCHRSYIVNVNYITTYLKTEVKMKNGALIPISRGYKFEE